MNLEELLEARRVAGLIIGFIQHALTPDQEAELDNWIVEKDENMKLFEQLTDEANLTESMKWFEQIDQESALHNVQLKIAEEEQVLLHEQVRNIRRKQKRTTARKLVARFSLAASVLLIAGIYLAQRYSTTPVPDKSLVVRSPSNKPGGNMRPGVTLLTAEGKKIDLGALKNTSIDLGNETTAENETELLVYSMASTAGDNTLIVPAGQQYSVLLSDGTQVWLNALSSLKYPAAFKGAERTVILQGEGYFEVAKNSRIPFSVQCNETVIKVTGTHFNVHGYQEDGEQKIVLLDGGIIVQKGKKNARLSPGQQALVSGQAVKVAAVSRAAESIAWTRGWFTFYEAPIQEIMREVSRWYGVQVIYEKKSDEIFSGSIQRNSTLLQVLRMIEASGGVHFTVKGNQVLVHS